MDESRIRNLVTAVISARQATIAQDLDERITRIVEGALSNALGNMNIADQTNRSRDTGHDWPPEGSNNHAENILGNTPESLIGDINIMNNAAKVANLINIWDIKFDG